MLKPVPGSPAEDVLFSPRSLRTRIATASNCPRAEAACRGGGRSRSITCRSSAAGVLLSPSYSELPLTACRLSPARAGAPICSPPLQLNTLWCMALLSSPSHRVRKQAPERTSRSSRSAAAGSGAPPLLISLDDAPCARPQGDPRDARQRAAAGHGSVMFHFAGRDGLVSLWLRKAGRGEGGEAAGRCLLAIQPVAAGTEGGESDSHHHWAARPHRCCSRGFQRVSAG